MVCASYAGYKKDTVVVLFTLAMGFMGPFFCGARLNSLDLSPNYSASLMATANGLGAIFGFVALSVTGSMTTNVSVFFTNFCFRSRLNFFNNSENIRRMEERFMASGCHSCCGSCHLHDFWFIWSTTMERSFKTSRGERKSIKRSSCN